jgi:hypothetical protein
VVSEILSAQPPPNPRFQTPDAEHPTRFSNTTGLPSVFDDHIDFTDDVGVDATVDASPIVEFSHS